jgi:hypothetical protein
VTKLITTDSNEVPEILAVPEIPSTLIGGLAVVMTAMVIATTRYKNLRK